jgi:galactose oxidase
MKNLHALFLTLLTVRSSAGKFWKGLRYLQSKSSPLYNITLDIDGLDPLFKGLSIPQNASEAGMWSGVKVWPIVAIHLAVLPDGRVVAYGAEPSLDIPSGRVFLLWDPKLGFDPASIEINGNAENVDSFCSAATLLRDGTLLVSGGSGTNVTTSLESSVLDYKTGKSSRAPDLNKPRWYATLIALPDGRALVSGGADPFVSHAFLDPDGASNQISSTPEIYTKGVGWKPLTGARSSDAFAAKNNRYWYPRQWVTPFGTIFGITTELLWEITTDGVGSIKILGEFKTPPNNITYPNVGPTSTAVMYDVGKILQVGGNGYANGFAIEASNLATILDINKLNESKVEITEVDPMTFRRHWANSIVLPNGEVVVTGGAYFEDEYTPYPIFEAEIWNPITRKWRIGASAAIYRGYHSTSVLLTNGVVASCGGGIPGPIATYNCEMYYPPYLFEKRGGKSVLASRPKIRSISSNTVKYGEKISVQMASVDTIREVSLIALSITTHAFNSNQRRLKLKFEVTASGLNVYIPSNANLAPPGYYHLTVLNSFGTPSTSVIIGIDALEPPSPGRIPKSVSEADIIDITGPFEIEVGLRFDEVENFKWQRVIELSNGPGKDEISFGQVANTGSVFLEIWKNGKSYTVMADNSIWMGQPTSWKFGVDGNGRMFIVKNGFLIAENKLGAVPADVKRSVKLLGRSSSPGIDNLHGSIMNLRMINTKVVGNGEIPTDGLTSADLNVDEITGPFIAEFIAYFEEVDNYLWQTIFSFDNGPRNDTISFGQFVNSNDTFFEIWDAQGTSSMIVASQSIKKGEVANWQVGVDGKGMMWIEKNGKRLVYEQGIVPRNITRSTKRLGRSSFEGNDDLHGKVLSFALKNQDAAILQVNGGISSNKTLMLDEITGPFEIEVVARFDNVKLYTGQKVFDFGNGPQLDNIILGQCESTNNMCFDLWNNRTKYRLEAKDAIIPKEVATWKVGVDPTGRMWLSKNGASLGEAQGKVPDKDILRSNKLLGSSNWPGDAPLQGAVLGINITHLGVPITPASSGGHLMNVPAQINGPFEVSAFARFDKLRNRQWQRIFDFGNGPTEDCILLGQCNDTNDMCFHIYKDFIQYSLEAAEVLREGEMAHWSVGVDATGRMWIKKNGVKVGEGQGVVPAKVQRNKNLVGDSNWRVDHKLVGVVLGLKVTT